MYLHWIEPKYIRMSDNDHFLRAETFTGIPTDVHVYHFQITMLQIYIKYGIGPEQTNSNLKGYRESYLFTFNTNKCPYT